MSDTKFSKTMYIALGVLFVANLILAFSLMSANKELSALRGTNPEMGTTQILHEGESVAWVGSGNRRVFAFLSYKCSQCEANIPAWNELGAQLGEAFTPICLDVKPEPKGEFVSGVFTPVVSHINDAFQRKQFVGQFAISELPMTVMLDELNTVLFVKYGALSGEDVERIVMQMQ